MEKKKIAGCKGLLLLLVVGFLLGALVTTIRTVQTQAATPENGWVKKTYYYVNGEMAKNKWLTIGKYKYYFGSNGKVTTGAEVLKGKFYRFTSTGKYDVTATKKLRVAAKYEKDFTALKKLIGKSKKSKYYAQSCYGPGQDGVLTYAQFKVYTYRYNGKEIFMGAE